VTAAQDRLARARAEAYAAEEMGSPELDVALAAVEQAEQDVQDEGDWCYACADVRRPECTDEPALSLMSYDAYIRHVCDLR
jgi:hypothetical protein